MPSAGSSGTGAALAELAGALRMDHFTTLIILLSFRPPCKTLSTSTFREGNKLLVKNKIQNYMEDIAARFTVHMAGTF